MLELRNCKICNRSGIKLRKLPCDGILTDDLVCSSDYELLIKFAGEQKRVTKAIVEKAIEHRKVNGIKESRFGKRGYNKNVVSQQLRCRHCSSQNVTFRLRSGSRDKVEFFCKVHDPSFIEFEPYSFQE